MGFVVQPALGTDQCRDQPGAAGAPAVVVEAGGWDHHDEVVMNQENHRDGGEDGHEDRHLVQVLDNHVEPIGFPALLEIYRSPQAERQPAPHTMDGDTVHELPGSGAGEPGGQKGDLVAPPSQSPEDLVEIVRRSARLLQIDLDETDFDDLLRRLRKAARQYAESVTWRVLIQQTWDVFFDAWPAGDAIELPKPPLRSVTIRRRLRSDRIASTRPWRAAYSSASPST